MRLVYFYRSVHKGNGRGSKRGAASTMHIAVPTQVGLMALCGRPILGHHWKDAPAKTNVPCRTCLTRLSTTASWEQIKLLFGVEWGEYVASKLRPSSDLEEVEVGRVIDLIPDSLDEPPMPDREVIALARRYLIAGGTPEGARGLWKAHREWRRRRGLPYLAWDAFVGEVLGGPQ
ncbi:hypothetical protein MN1_320 [Thermus phage MN1]|nr:hypothetical protein MN1_320 [Thermus phage MN1]